MTGEVERRGGGEGRLWFALLGGPAAWTAHLLASYPLVRVACSAGSVWMLHGVTILSVAVATIAAWVGWSAYRAFQSDPEGAAPAGVGRARFMALMGGILSGFFAAVTLAEGLPVLFADPCLRGP